MTVNTPKKISHFGVHKAETGQPIAMNANAGDTLLFEATRILFDRFLGPIEWKLEALWKEVDTEKVHQLNEKSHAILVGGGGLFLRDQAGADASRSGWQWNCAPERIREFSIPLIVFGVGYNRFRNQSDFDPVFADHITALVEQSAFFGLRNHGSIEAIREYLPPELRSRVVYQPCPTTIAAHLYPAATPSEVSPKEGRRLVLNAAFDRREMRFGTNEERVLTQLAEVMRECHAEGWDIVLANHKPQDAEMGRFLEAAGVPYTEQNLAATYPADIVTWYRDADLVVGMRGHAQMIPFGLHRPIVSIISHDKMQWFLDDIGHPEWGVDVRSQYFAEELLGTIRAVATNPQVPEMLLQAQEKLWQVTSENMRFLTGVLRHE